MGLSKIEGGAKVSCTYSKDVFRLEICGPDEDHLSVTDIPGIFSNTTPGLTTMKDMEMVKRMVLDYMNNPRSIILAVVPANVDIATQGILQMARQCDPEGIRTLGIFTKPDLADKGTEGRILDLVKGRTRSLKLGWSVVRNPGQEQSSDPNFDRDASETEFFRDYTPWSYLQKEKVGAYALRMRLQAVQAEHIRREFPKVNALCCVSG